MKSLRATILVSFLAVVVISAGSLFFVSARYSRLAVRQSYRTDIFTVEDRICETVSDVMNQQYTFIHYLAEMDIFRSDKYTLEQKQEALNPIARAFPETMVGLNYLDSKGDILIDHVGMLNFADQEYFTEPFYNNKTVHVGPFLNTVNQRLTLFFACPVKGYDNKNIGTILMCLDCSFLCDISKDVKIGNTGYAIIIDRADGCTIGAPQREDVDNRQNLMAVAERGGYPDLKVQMEKVLAGEKDWGTFTIAGTKRIMLYEPIKNTDWSVIVMADDKEVLLQLKGMEWIQFISTIVFILIGVIVALFIARALTPLKTVGLAITEIASGNADLTKRLEIKKAKKEIASVVNGFNAFTEKLQTIVQALKDSQGNLSVADEELSASTQDTAASITQIIANIESVNSQIINQSASVQETAGAVNEIASNIESLENMISKQSSNVNDASSAVEEMVGNINSVNSSVEKMVSSFSELEENASLGIHTQADVNERIRQIEEQSKMLQDANAAIAEIAEQTNLLAMNAAIEAAHAGEAGKGFSVVADEIRKLSETSTSQSKTIGDELTKIESSILEVVTASDKATTAFTTVSTSIKNTDEILRQIKSAMEEQTIGSKQIIDSLHSMNDSTLEVKSASTEMGEGNKLILSHVQRLQNATSNMKDSISEMSAGARKINETGASLSAISGKVTDSIKQIGDEIDQFKV